MATNPLPPYGVFPPRLEKIAQVDEAMPDWQHKLEDDIRHQSFLAWRNEMRKTLSNSLWPYFDRTARQWEGLAKNFADASTRQEIEIMVEHLQGANTQLTIEPPICDVTEFGSTHLKQFKVEDAPSQPAGVNMRDYVCSLTDDQFGQARKTIDLAYDRKLRNLFWLKREFVRPRPYQCALIFNFDQFHSEVAFSATHSSFYSGHCLEGILFSAAVAETWLADPTSYSGEMLIELMRYSVDFGDRRVFAGVHYPTDNISSWFLALNIIPNIFDNPLPIQQFVVDAIKQHSFVYRLINEEYVKHDILEPAMLLLEGALNLNQSFT